VITAVALVRGARGRSLSGVWYVVRCVIIQRSDYRADWQYGKRFTIYDVAEVTKVRAHLFLLLIFCSLQ